MDFGQNCVPVRVGMTRVLELFVPAKVGFLSAVLAGGIILFDQAAPSLGSIQSLDLDLG